MGDCDIIFLNFISLLATVNILANDDGHGIISFNTTEHFLLREPTSMSGLSESVATLYVVRNPEEGTFGTVRVQFAITDANGSLADRDLRPAQGFVVLEDGLRFKVRESNDSSWLTSHIRKHVKIC